MAAKANVNLNNLVQDVTTYQNQAKQQFRDWLVNVVGHQPRASNQTAQAFENALKYLGPDTVKMALTDIEGFEKKVDEFDTEKAGIKSWWPTKFKRAVRYWVDWANTTNGGKRNNAKPKGELLGSTRSRSTSEAAAADEPKPKKRQQATAKAAPRRKTGGESAVRRGPGRPPKSEKATRTAAQASSAAKESAKTRTTAKAQAPAAKTSEEVDTQTKAIEDAVENAKQGTGGIEEIVNAMATSYRGSQQSESVVALGASITVAQLPLTTQFRLLESIGGTHVEDPLPQVAGRSVSKVMSAVLVDYIIREVQRRL